MHLNIEVLCRANTNRTHLNSCFYFHLDMHLHAYYKANIQISSCSEQVRNQSALASEVIIVQIWAGKHKKKKNTKEIEGTKRKRKTKQLVALDQSWEIY